MDTTFTSQEFDRDISAAKKAALRGPVTITDHGRRSHVLLSAEDYDKLAASNKRLGDILWRGQDPAIELEIEQRKCRSARSS
ncbi:type II toxin-antitoxin system prevent-host-death family antitoxin [Glutamicibacter uratoxydans]|uniref:type II toxin-antitoxin system prevent-host-death family antitoxin n=1 Tax=Glutamicibacter uratoxydans TaxID=43667 RepID=UPI00114517F1|nr:type II toxin-antitoxin system prevent-host-death family antitoxin [Glutamicibacter uratoxydans]